jgi:putative hydrolases of HD superfamily
MSDPISAYLAFIRDAEALKNTLRSGHTSSGRPESTAEHSWRLALFALVLKDELGDMDFAKVLMLCLVHDLGEALHGDVPATEAADPAAKSERERRDLAALLAPLPKAARERLMALWEEYEADSTPEARFVKGLDKLETMVQHNQGKNAPAFDYAFNLGYGVVYTERHPLLAAMRRQVDDQTRERDREGGLG